MLLDYVQMKREPSSKSEPKFASARLSGVVPHCIGFTELGTGFSIQKQMSETIESKVVDRLNALGVTASYEYPGYVNVPPSTWAEVDYIANAIVDALKEKGAI